MDLTQEEMNFLKTHGVCKDNLFDARECTTDDRKKQMKEVDAQFCLGTICKKGHRLRTRSGHCIQCDTSRMAYMKRNDAIGYIYIAGSIQNQWIKIGQAKNITDRERSLNQHQYAGASDWVVITYAKLDKSGQIENSIKEELSQFHDPLLYNKQGKDVKTQEVYRCNLDLAYSAFEKSIAGKDILEHKPIKLEYCERYRSFPNKTSN